MNIYEVVGRWILEEEKRRLADKQEYIRTNIEEATKEVMRMKTASASEQEMRAAQLRTQGKKGCKAPRINMAFTPDNHRFLKREARKSGMTITQYCNQIITKYRIAKEEE